MPLKKQCSLDGLLNLTELLPVTSVEVSQSQTYGMLDIEPLVVGNRYIVIVDGVKYNLTCYVSDVYPTLGSEFGGSFEEYPFCINTYLDNTYIMFKELGEHTISIYSQSIVPMLIEDMYYSELNPIIADIKGLNISNSGIGDSYFTMYGGFQLEEGKSYTVTINGFKYENLLAIHGPTGAYIGSSPSAKPTNELPFSIFNYSGDIQINSLTMGLHDIKITLDGERVHTIDPKYLPFTNAEEASF